MFRFRRWLVPTLFGPAAGAWIAATIFAVAGYTDPKLGDAFQNWVLGMALGTVIGLGMSAAFTAVDVALLKASARLLPTGARAWWCGLASVPALFIVWRLWPGGADAAFWVVPPLLVALGGRLLASPRSGGRR
jgi:hypothetical protein